ncbi:MAG: hypothetical protein OEW75_04445, partial [Cyclobacteriaceae bacterium]|nr:hypothetical protein [Cyclobacteriaceae bacterium]
GKDKSFDLLKRDITEAEKCLHTALKDTVSACETIGHISYKQNVDHYCEFLSEEGDYKKAIQYQSNMHKVFSDRKVLPSVLNQISLKKSQYEAK